MTDALARAQTRVVPALRIVLLRVLAAVVYGVVHDQVTARCGVGHLTRDDAAGAG